MAVYYVLLAVILAAGITAFEWKPSRAAQIAFYVVSFGFMWFLSTFRFGLGFDYFSYRFMFESIQELSFGQILLGSEYRLYLGFALLLKVVSLFTHSYIFLCGVFAAITLGCFFIAVRRFSKVPWLSVFAYQALSLFYCSMNLIRQAMVFSILLFCLPFLKKGRFLPYLGIVLLASTIHISALVMIPVFFFARLRVTPVSLGAVCGIFLAGFLFLEPLIRLAARFVPLVASYIGTSYLNGGSYKYAIFPVLFALAAIALRNQLHQKDPANDIYINLCLYCALAYIAVVKVFMMERFGMMFSIYICFLIAEMAELFPARLGRAAPSEQAAPAAPEAPAAPDGQKKRGLSTLAKRWCVILPFLIGALLVNQYYLSVGGHKARPYGTVFNEEWVQLQIDNYSFEPGNTGWKRWKFF